MAKIFYADDCNLGLLSNKTVAVIGYGSQGHAHALNLKESGVNVIVGLYNGSKSWAVAEAAGLKVYTAAEAAAQADIIMILINDEKQAQLYKESIEPNLSAGKVLALIKGRFNVSYSDIEQLAYPVLRHRIKLNFEAIAERVSADDVIKAVVAEVSKKYKNKK